MNKNRLPAAAGIPGEIARKTGASGPVIFTSQNREAV